MVMDTFYLLVTIATATPEKQKRENKPLPLHKLADFGSNQLGGKNAGEPYTTGWASQNVGYFLTLPAL